MTLPKGWQNVTLSSSARVIDCKHRTPIYTDEGVPLISPGSIEWGSLRFDKCKRVSKEDHQQLMSHCRVNIGDIVMSRNQSVGVAAYVVSHEPFALGQDTVLIKPSGINAAYLYHYIQRPAFQMQIAKLGGGSTFNRINLAQIRQLHIIAPTLPEQRKIAEILTAWDTAIYKFDELIDAQERRKKSLMHQLLTGKRPINGASGTVKFVKASELFTNRSERNTDELPILSVTQDQGVVLRSSLERRINHDKETNGSYKVVRKGDFVISLRSFQGGLEYADIDGAVSPAYHVIHPRQHLECVFFKHYFKSADFVSRLATAVIGIRDGKQISFADFGFIKLPFPPVEDQQRIGHLLDTFDQELRLIRNQRIALEQQKRGLMQRLLTGKIRVNA